MDGDGGAVPPPPPPTKNPEGGGGGGGGDQKWYLIYILNVAYRPKRPTLHLHFVKQSVAVSQTEF